MRETYSAQAVESEVQAMWKAKDVYRAVENAVDNNGPVSYTHLRAHET